MQKATDKSVLASIGALTPLAVIVATSFLIAYRVGYHSRTNYTFINLDSVQSAIVSRGACVFATMVALASLSIALILFRQCRQKVGRQSILHNSDFWGALCLIALAPALFSPYWGHGGAYQNVLLFLSFLFPTVMVLIFGLEKRKFDRVRLVIVCALFFIYGCVISYASGRITVDLKWKKADNVVVKTKTGGEEKGTIFHLSENMIVVCTRELNCKAIYRDNIETI
jgi:hypothetical protein